jgi:hypothetical protein
MRVTTDRLDAGVMDRVVVASKGPSFVRMGVVRPRRCGTEACEISESLQ